MVPLHVVHPERLQGRQFRGRFHTLGDHLRLGLPGELDQRGGQRPARRVGIDAAGQAEVQLDDVGMDRQHVPHARVTCACVVDGHAHAGLAKGRKAPVEQTVVVDQRMLGDLQHHAVRLQVVDVPVDAAADERLWRHVEAHMEISGDATQAIERGQDGVEFQAHTQADLARFGEPYVGRSLRLQPEA